MQGALQAGAIGYLIKDVTSLDLITAIRAASAGQSTFSAEPLRDLVQVPAAWFHPGDDLTEREHEVLALMVEGASNAQIAEKLVVSVAAVKYHVSGILVKLGAANRTEAGVARAGATSPFPKGRRSPLSQVAAQHELIDQQSLHSATSSCA